MEIVVKISRTFLLLTEKQKSLKTSRKQITVFGSHIWLQLLFLRPDVPPLAGEWCQLSTRTVLSRTTFAVTNSFVCDAFSLRVPDPAVGFRLSLSSMCVQEHGLCLTLTVSGIIIFYGIILHTTYVVTNRLTTGTRSEKCVVRRVLRCANVIVCTYTNLDTIAYYTHRLNGIAYCS
jgi:hypothetical protein